MSSFKDNQGRIWDIEVNVGTIRTVRQKCNVNLYDIADSENSLTEQLSSDPVLLVDILNAICQEQITLRGVTEKQFFESFDGDVLEDAVDALLESIVFFFPGAKRKLMEQALKSMRQEKKKMEQEVQELVSSGKLEKIIEGQTSKKLSIMQPESAE